MFFNKSNEKRTIPEETTPKINLKFSVAEGGSIAQWSAYLHLYPAASGCLILSILETYFSDEKNVDGAGSGKVDTDLKMLGFFFFCLTFHHKVDCPYTGPCKKARTLPK